MRAGARYLRDTDRRPTLAGIFKALQSVKLDERAAPQREELSSSERLAPPDAFLWMKFWPDPVPPELRERHERAWREMGREPYYPNAGGGGIRGI